MKGNVLGFDPASNSGAISGHDGQHYAFVTLDWRGSGPPVRGSLVDFAADGTHARQIYPLLQQFDPREGGTANVIYILYLVGLLVGITSIVGLIIAYVNRDDAPEWLRSHYRFQVRTFWIGLLYGVIGVVTSIIVVGAFWLIFVVVWWIVRCVKGMQALSRGAPYERVEAWFW